MARRTLGHRDRRQGRRRPRRRRLQLAAGVVALPPPSPGDGERRAADLALPHRPGARISSRTQDPERTDARQAFIPVQTVHLFDDGALVALGARPSSASATRRPCAWNGRPIRRRRCRCASSRPASPKVFGLFETNLHLIAPADPEPAHLPAGLRPAGPRSVVAHHARHPDLDDGRPGGGGAERDPGRRAGRHLGLCRRQDRPGDPAPDRAAAVGADHPDLAGAVGRPAARLDADPGLLRHHRDPVAGRLDDARPRGARPLPRPARGGFRAGRPPRRLLAHAHHPAPHGADLPEPHHRHQLARHPGDDHQRDVAVASWASASARRRSAGACCCRRRRTSRPWRWRRGC